MNFFNNFTEFSWPCGISQVITAGAQCIFLTFIQIFKFTIWHVEIIGTGKLCTGIPVSEIPMHRYEKYRYPRIKRMTHGRLFCQMTSAPRRAGMMMRTRSRRSTARSLWVAMCEGNTSWKILLLFFRIFKIVRSRLLGFGPGGYPSNAYFSSHAY